MTEEERMVAAFIESPVYKGNELDVTLVSLIRKGLVHFEYPDLFTLTEKGAKVDEMLYGMVYDEPMGHA